jgi:hypothetical protein
VLGAESKASLEYERTETERAKNAVAFIDAQTEGERALHAFNTVDKDNALYDAQRDAETARLEEAKARSAKENAAQMEEFEKVRAINTADKE